MSRTASRGDTGFIDLDLLRGSEVRKALPASRSLSPSSSQISAHHPLGRAKLTRLNRADPGPRWSAPSPELLARLRRIWEEELAGTRVPVVAR